MSEARKKDMNAVPKKKGLGRGLEALLGGSADITEAVKIEGAPNTLRSASCRPASTSRARMDEGSSRSWPPAFARKA
jgi:ParB family chromosome partitioning protein